MSLLINKIVHFIIGVLICLIPAEKLFLNPAEEKDQGNSPGCISGTEFIKGYRNIMFYDGKYLAVGSDGRIDYISSSGGKSSVVSKTRNNLNCITAKDKVVVIGGDKGTILFSSDGRVFSTVESGVNARINGITSGNGLFIAGADGGIILISNNGNSWGSIRTEARGNIISVTANDSFFIGITEIGEILISKDGFKWDIRDYNKVYSGYNKSCIFKKVLAANNRIVIIGMHDDNSPAVLFSTLGNVWTERSLVFDDNQGIMRFLTNEPNAITYDSVRDQFILACDKGEIFTLPSCSKCNESAIISDSDLYAITCSGNLLICVGREFSVNIMNL
ncbi:MAG: hypothetical protein A2Y71_15510 [Bacteroidetes bacterium RBG_13_42_15]|nr:MAG: hypothetical protein A2Y71_15510 [Bacteroidetes bacterium RBG_13_42_15]